MNGKAVAAYQYDNDHLLLPVSGANEIYHIYYGYSKKQPFQRWNTKLYPIPDNYRLRQRDVTRRYPNSPDLAGTIDSLKQNSPFIRNRRELWRRIGNFAVARTDLMARIHTALVSKTPLERLSNTEFLGTEKLLLVKNCSIRTVAAETLEDAFLSHFRNRRGNEASRIFFTQRPFDTDRNFVTCFFGNLAIEEAGEYEFRLNTNSTRIFRVDGKTVLRRFGEFQNPNSYEIGSADILTINLSRGSHFLEFLYYKGPIANWAAVSWRRKGQGGFNLLCEDDFAPAIPLLPSLSESRNGKRYPVVLRDDSLALYTEKQHAYSLDRYQILTPSAETFWELDGKRFSADIKVFALRNLTEPILKLASKNPDYLPLEIIRKPRTGTKAPLRPDISMRVWTPHFLYDDEFASVTLEINSGLPVNYTAILKINAPENPVFPAGEEYLPVSAIPMEHEDRYAKNRIIKKSYLLEGKNIKKELSVDFNLSLPGLSADSKSLRILPVRSLPEELYTSSDGLLDSDGRRLLPILHRTSLHEIRAWELPRKLGSEWKKYNKLLVIAEDLPGFREMLTKSLADQKIKLEFLPWSKTALPSGSAIMETLPDARKIIAKSDADCAIMIPPSSVRHGILGSREELNMLSLLLELLSINKNIRNIVLSTPFPLSPFELLEQGRGEQEFHESLRRLSRERGTGFLELNAFLRKNQIWKDDNYIVNGIKKLHSPALLPQTVKLISAEFERK